MSQQAFFDGRTFTPADTQRLTRQRPQASAICTECGVSFTRDAYRFKTEPVKFCGKTCYAKARRNSDAEAFWANTRRAESGCLEWRGAPLTTGGYGRLRVGGKQTKAHRHAYELAHGPIPDGMSVCHHCDNPICVDPAHLFLGTAHDNMQDMAQKGRAAGFKRKGEKHPMAKLSDAQVAEIGQRFMFRSYGRTNAQELATEYGVSDSRIREIAKAAGLYENRPPHGKPRFGNYVIERQRIAGGLYKYRIGER